MIKKKWLQRLSSIYYPLLAIITSMIIGGVFIAALGFDPIKAYKGLLSGSLGTTKAFFDSLNKAVPIILTGLSFAIANKCGLVNLGAEGQLISGAMCAAIVGAYLHLPLVLHVIATILAGFLGGALIGGIAGWAKNKFEANELIVTIMLNYISASMVDYLIAGPLRGASSQGNFPQSATILETARLGKVFGTRLHSGIFIAILMLVLYYFFLSKTTSGYEMRVVGLNKNAAAYAGIDIKSNSFLAMFIAGGFAGTAGAVELCAIQYRIMEGFSTNYGFDGVAVALLGNNSPVGIFFSGTLLGILKAGSNKMQVLTSVPSSTFQVIQGLIILFVVGRKLFDFSSLGKKHKKGAVK